MVNALTSAAQKRDQRHVFATLGAGGAPRAQSRKASFDLIFYWQTIIELMGRAKQQKNLKAKRAAETKSGKATVAQNRKARHDYHLGKEIIAGIVLQGTEVKSLRLGQVQLKACYAKIIDGEAWLFNCQIAEYSHGITKHDPMRAKKLLLNRAEIDKIEFELATTNKTLVATKVFFKANHAKVNLSLAEGKKQHDKRETLKKKAQQRDIDRATSKY